MSVYRMKTWKKTVKCPDCGQMCNYLGLGSHRFLKHGFKADPKKVKKCPRSFQRETKRGD